MAKKRKHHKKHHRYLGNPPRAFMNALMIVGSAGVGYLASRVATTYGARWLPHAVPVKAREPLAAAAAGTLAFIGAEFALKRWPLARIGAQAAGGVPFVESLANMTPFGAKIGTLKTILINAPEQGAPQLPAPGISAALQAALRDRDEGDFYVNGY